MYQIVEPKFKSSKRLDNLVISTKCYDESVIVTLHKLEGGEVVFSKTFDSYDKESISEIKSFIDMYNNKIKDEKYSEIDHMG